MTGHDENRRPVPGTDSGSGDTAPELSPDSDLVRELAAEIVLDHARDVEFLSIAEMVGEDDRTKHLGKMEQHFLCRAVDRAVGRAQVTVTIPSACDDENQRPVPGDGDTSEGVSPLRGWPNPTLVMALRLARPERAVDLFHHTPARIHAYLTARHWVCHATDTDLSLWHHPKLSSRFPLPGFERIVIPDTHPRDAEPGDDLLATAYRQRVGVAVAQLADAYGIGEISILAGIANTEPVP